MITDDTPCSFCAQLEYSPELGRKCLPLLHLAIFLTNGSPTYVSRRHLEERSDGTANGCLRDRLYGYTISKETQTSEECTPKGEWVAGAGPTSTAGGKAGSSNRRYGEPGPAGASIRDAFAAGARKHHSDHAGGLEEVAPGGENNIPPTCLVIVDDQNGAGQGGDAVQVESTGATVAGLSEPRTDRWPGQYAFHEVEREGQEVGAVEGCHSFDSGGGALLSEPASVGRGPHHDFEVPQSGEDNKLHGQSDPVVVAPEQPPQLGGLVRNPSIMLSCFLATDRGTDTPTNNGENSALEGRAESLEHRQVRLLDTMWDPPSLCVVDMALDNMDYYFA